MSDTEEKPPALADEKSGAATATVASSEEAPPPPSTPLIALKYGGGLLVGASIWLWAIAQQVEGVYLDEEFHVRQALVYADRKFHIWDPKITTPPGLYLASYPWLQALIWLRVPGSPATHLRSLNTLGLLALWATAWALADAIQAERQPAPGEDHAKSDSARDAAAVAALRRQRRRQTAGHVALNAALFPPLFFFAALYYTDVLSALCVLLAHLAFYRDQPAGVLVAGAVSLLFRQTNIVWTALYLGGLEVQRQLDRMGRARRGRRKPTGTLSWGGVAHLAFQEGALYDLDAPAASVEDYLKTAFSLILATLANLPSLMLPLAPYVTLLGLFGGFVYQNGGVVLGDKSNHVASIHTPQLLYLWPALVFFSFGPLVTNALMVVAAIAKHVNPEGLLDNEWNLPDEHLLPRLPVLGFFTVLATVAVHFNTIIHPFILADNRHYTFYVFRLLTRRPLVRYAVTPIYVACGWLALSAGIAGYTARQKSGIQSVKTSVVLIWLLATAAALATSPLVEPRYFIVPYLVWRLNLHTPSTEDHPDWDANDTQLAAVEREFLGYETNWSILINLATIYIFLFWGFEWPQEPGKIMRFMW